MIATYLYVQEFSEDGTELVGDPVQLVRNDQVWMDDKPHRTAFLPTMLKLHL